MYWTLLAMVQKQMNYLGCQITKDNKFQINKTIERVSE